MSETFSKKKIYKNLENALEKLLKINFFAFTPEINLSFD